MNRAARVHVDVDYTMANHVELNCLLQVFTAIQRFFDFGNGVTCVTLQQLNLINYHVHHDGSQAPSVEDGLVPSVLAGNTMIPGQLSIIAWAIRHFVRLDQVADNEELVPMILRRHTLRRRVRTHRDTLRYWFDIEPNDVVSGLYLERMTRLGDVHIALGSDMATLTHAVQWVQKFKSTVNIDQRFEDVN
ncbi:hypothetical protein BBO99_00001449 [Phytophthora kernoviae]|uniref:Uncharacterized protein n=2 Tax=Phytophthora kernoviae TaxID=325452 RepID=A0A3R7HAL1_9STRA|nr:hypothetical protein G195_009548 [Phytophthora kernoviae 00238/432]KAG2523948.1 hypothetical protein JM16_005110 [Phytophthora kernoviae]KAG2532333.1 hypothetical protein JM18_001300 [Phytophthora kernoviae]RLN43870.1 hypothetical protein BBI17_001239 [Phytophthora kernoviae]RLN84250.1 hypothetical protein BBO99_00001449 [Phytophthora kernoviae]